MDGRRFDDWTRTVTAGVSRRSAAKALAGGAMAATMALLGSRQAAAVVCRGTDRLCRRDAQCCSNRCITGRCDCKPRGTGCSLDKACCSRVCLANGTCR